MDWIKAKNILIIALIATNIFLVYNSRNMIFGEGHNQAKSEYFYESAISFLKERGLVIEADVPKNNILMPMIMVEYELFDHEEIAKLFLGPEYEVINNTVFVYKDKMLKAEGNKKLLFFDNSNESVVHKLSDDKVQELSEKFLNEHLLTREGLVLEEINLNVLEEENLYYEVVFRQKHNEFFLENLSRPSFNFCETALAKPIALLCSP